MLARCYGCVSTRFCGGLDFPAFHRVDEGAFSSTGTEPSCCQRLACSFASCRALFALRFRAVPRHPSGGCVEMS
jgi:hypothetical protein